MNLTVEKFLKDGHLFEDGDSFSGMVTTYTVGSKLDGLSTTVEYANKLMPCDKKRFVIKARCLMLPKHFRLYKDVDGLIAVVDKKADKYWWAVNLDIEDYDIESAVVHLNLGDGQDTDNLTQRTLVPIISFAQLGE